MPTHPFLNIRLLSRKRPALLRLIAEAGKPKLIEILGDVRLKQCEPCRVSIYHQQKAHLQFRVGILLTGF